MKSIKTTEKPVVGIDKYGRPLQYLTVNSGLSRAERRRRRKMGSRKARAVIDNA